MYDIAPLLWIPLLVIYVPQAVVLAAVDLREHRLPNAHVGVLTLTVGGSVLVVGIIDAQVRSALGWAVGLGVACAVIGVGLALLAPRLIGMGDAKVAPVIVFLATALGPEVLIAGGLGVALLGGSIGIIVLARTRDGATRFAFGPVLLAWPVLGLLGAPVVTAALGNG